MSRQISPCSVLALFALTVLALPASSEEQRRFSLRLFAGPALSSGGVLNDPFTDLLAYKKYRPEIQFLVVPGFGKVEHEFLVEGRGPITISYDSRHAGKLTKTVKLD